MAAPCDDGRGPDEVRLLDGENGARRPMKMGTITSPWRYDVAADQAIWPDSLRRAAIFRYAYGDRLPDFAAPSGKSQDRRDG